MKDLCKNTASYRDPSGYIYEHSNRVYRSVTDFGKKQYDDIREDNIIRDAVSTGFLIPTHELEPEEWPEEIKNSAYVLNHEKIPYISYPYEWSFYQLKTAALHHLDFQLFLFDKGFILKDASAYNIQFIGGKPIFIDVLSIQKYRTGEYWISHKQFCENFLNPLLLRSLVGIAHNSWFRGTVEGISTLDLANLIPLKKSFSWNVFTQVILQAKFERSIIQNSDNNYIKKIKTKQFSKLAYKGFLQQMRNWINQLYPRDTGKTVWSDYANNHTYSNEETIKKREFISEFSNTIKPKTLVDLGCNTGDYSLLALKSSTEYVIGFDFDQNALEGAYHRTKDDKSFLSLYLDFSNPSPNQGWRQSERLGFEQRTKVDGLLALAFIHHLVIAKNIPLEQLINWLVNIAPTGIIEFIPKNDPTIIKMLSLREDIFLDYNETNFENILKQRAHIVKKMQVSNTGRTLFWYNRI